MPTYEYVCKKCRKRFTLLMTVMEYETQLSPRRREGHREGWLRPDGSAVVKL